MLKRISTVFAFATLAAFAQPGALVFSKSGDAWIMNTDGSNQTRLTSVGGVTLVRLSNNVLVYQTGGRLYKATLQGLSFSAPPQAIPNTAGVLEFDLSPDGLRVALTYSANTTLYTLNIDGSSLTAVNSSSAHQSGVTWGRDGFLYFVQSAVGNALSQTLFRIPQNGLNNPVQLTSYFSQFPAAGAPSNRIAFLYDYPVKRMRTMNPDGSGQQDVPGLTLGDGGFISADYLSDFIYYTIGDQIWRIRSDGSSKQLLITGVLNFVDFGTLAIDNTVQLTAPADSATIRFPEQFSWKAAAGAVSYVVQVASTPAFNSTVSEFQTTSTSIRIPDNIPEFQLSAERWWRVRAVLASGSTVLSGARSFRITTGSISAPAAPSRVSPADGSTSSARQLSFIWSTVAGATGYVLKYATRADFLNQVTVTALETSASAEFPAGDYTVYWKVGATNGSGAGAESSTGSFLVRTSAAISSVVIDLPSNAVVAQGAALTATARLTGTYSGTVTGYWLIDSSERRDFSSGRSSVEKLILALPTGSVGTHSVKVFLTAPLSTESAAVGYRVDALAGPPVRLLVKADELALPLPGTSRANVRAVLVDAQGRLVPSSGRSIAFRVVLPNITNSSLTAASALTVSGTAATVLAAGVFPGIVTVEASSSGLESGSLSLADGAPAMKTQTLDFLSALEHLSVPALPGVFEIGLPDTFHYSVGAIRSLVNSLDLSNPSDVDLLERCLLAAQTLYYVYGIGAPSIRDAKAPVVGVGHLLADTGAGAAAMLGYLVPLGQAKVKLTKTSSNKQIAKSIAQADLAVWSETLEAICGGLKDPFRLSCQAALPSIKDSLNRKITGTGGIENTVSALLNVATQLLVTGIFGEVFVHATDADWQQFSSRARGSLSQRPALAVVRQSVKDRISVADQNAESAHAFATKALGAANFLQDITDISASVPAVSGLPGFNALISKVSNGSKQALKWLTFVPTLSAFAAAGGLLYAASVPGDAFVDLLPIPADSPSAKPVDLERTAVSDTTGSRFAQIQATSEIAAYDLAVQRATFAMDGSNAAGFRTALDQMATASDRLETALNAAMAGLSAYGLRSAVTTELFVERLAACRSGRQRVSLTGAQLAMALESAAVEPSNTTIKADARTLAATMPEALAALEVAMAAVSTNVLLDSPNAAAAVLELSKPLDVFPGIAFRVDAVVTNPGGATAAGVHVELQLPTGVSSANTRIAVGDLAPGARVPVSWSLTAGPDSGEIAGIDILPTSSTVNAVLIPASDSVLVNRFALSSSTVSVAAAGGSGTVTLSYAPLSPVPVSTNASWITAAMIGNILSYSITPSTGAARTGSILVGGQTITISQIAAGGPSASNGPFQFVPVTPCRLVDTRVGQGKSGAFGPPSLPAGGVRSVPAPAGSCDIPAGVAAYSINVTVVPAAGLSYLTLWPDGQPRPLVSTLNSFDGRIVANAAVVPAGANGAFSIFVTDSSDVIVDINGYFTGGALQGQLFFVPLRPCRLMDTRPAEGKTGAFGPPQMQAASTRTVPVTASGCGVPSSARAYALNATVVPAEPLAYLTIYPTGQSRPLVSTLNSFQGTVVANAAVVPAGTGGAIDVFVTNRTDVILDINGYFTATPPSEALRFYTAPPCRVMDTRAGQGKQGSFGPPAVGAGGMRSMNASTSGCAIPANGRAFALNITVVPKVKLSYLTVWPSDQSRPLVSTLNSFDGNVVANAAIVPASASGEFSVFVTDETDVIVDINGYFAP